MNETTIISVFRKSHGELVVRVNEVELVLYNHSYFHFDEVLIDARIMMLSPSEFQAFKDWQTSHPGLFDAFHDLYCSWRCSGLDTIQPKHMKVDSFAILSNLGLLTADEERSVAIFLERSRVNEKTDTQRDTPTQIYLMKDERTGFHKIGRSIKPLTRERTLQSDNPLITLIFSAAGVVKNEREWHTVFADKRVRGEWFDLTDDDVRLFVDTMSKETLI